MAKTIIKNFYRFGRADEINIVPLGDLHLGASACDEGLFLQTVKRINDSGAYWIGMGDYCDFINVRDPRFRAATLAPWITVQQLGDLAEAQKNRFLDYVKPIASKCLALVKGNHEDTIHKYYERDIYSEIVTGVKKHGGFAADKDLGVDYYGWLVLRFSRGKEDSRAANKRSITFNLHHGFVGGKLAGAKALNMQRWLWNHETDVVIFGHSHNTGAQREAIEYIDTHGNVRTKNRVGCYSGTFLKSTNGGVSTYSEVKGYFPLPIGGVEIVVRPYDKHEQFVRVTM